MSRIGTLAALVIAFLAAGCGGPPPLAIVRGKVTLRGQPLANVRVEFVPEETVGPKFLRSIAVTDASGAFDLVCDNGERGAMVGWHRVVVATIRTNRDPGASVREHESQNNPRGGSSKAQLNLSPYSSVVTTPEKYEVKLGENVADLKLGN